MRLAEFKIRLLVFFADALRKWAGSIEPATDEQTLRENPVDDSGANAPAEFRREAGAASGPPEHWTRLVATAPPDHWLDLIRERAPHLLPASEDGSVSSPTEGTSYGEPLELQLDPNISAPGWSGTDTEQRSAPKPRSQRSERSERSAASTPRINGAKWLRRLRFQPPRQRPAPEEIDQTASPINEATKASGYSASLPDHGPAAADHESSLTVADKYDQGKDPHRRPDRGVTLEFNGLRVRDSNERRDLQPRLSEPETEIATRDSLSRQSTKQDSLPDHSSRRVPEPTPRKPINDLGFPHSSNIVPSIAVERPVSNPANARARSVTDSADEAEPPNRTARSGAVADESASRPSSTFPAALNDAGALSRPFRQVNVSVNRSVVGPRSHSSETEKRSAPDHQASQRIGQRDTSDRSRGSQPPMTANARTVARSASAKARSEQMTKNSARGPYEPARHRFASADFATPALNESSESMWPALPPSRNFETNFQIRDELAAMEREVESLRRLDREQRGNQWSA